MIPIKQANTDESYFADLGWEKIIEYLSQSMLAD